MKKVKVITFHAVPNYGALMQSYGMCAAVAELGYDVELIDYRPDRGAISTKKKASDPEQWDLFEEYLKQNLPLTRTIYSSPDDLQSIEADYLICGSDQIWNLGMSKARDNRVAYFLDFGPSSAKRISYAASTGGTEISTEHLGFVKQALSRFSSISVREPQTVNEVQQITNRRVDVVLDPTLLCQNFPEYDLKSKNLLPEKYIAVYSLQTSPALLDAITKLKKLYKIPVVSIGLTETPLADVCMTGLSPGEWTTAIKNADFVITNSFHGTVFSIKYRKQFLSVPLVRKKSKRKCRLEVFIHRVNLQNYFSCLKSELSLSRLAKVSSPKNARIKNILNITDLQDRFYKYHVNFEFLQNQIDYDAVENRLGKHIEHSRNFLKDALAIQ